MPVVFDIADFQARFPAFEADTEPFLSGCFERAEGFVANVEGSAVSDLAERKSLLYLVTAHIGMLEKRGAMKVGQLNSASQGSVSASFSPVGNPGSGDWWKQTQYGAEFWQRTIKYRSFMYFPPD